MAVSIPHIIFTGVVIGDCSDVEEELKYGLELQDIYGEKLPTSTTIDALPFLQWNEVRRMG